MRLVRLDRLGDMQRGTPAVDNHPQGKLIVDMILSGTSLEKVRSAINPPINVNTLRRFRNILLARSHAIAKKTLGDGNSGIQNTIMAGEIIESASAELIEQGVRISDPLLAYMEFAHQRREKLIGKAVVDGDIKGFTGLDGNALKSVELVGRLQGRFASEQANVTTNIAVVIPARETGGE